ncbi:MAG: flagellar export chaperone FliS [Candidatus Krumholzibacteriota bacterium]|nr:flagellar export chaperone FliS [Candidatus Krumholzibacteriota bacterium]
MKGIKNASTLVTNRYNQVKVETADQLTLITMLYDGLVRFLTSALEKMEQRENAHEDCIRARDIANHLMRSTIDDGSEVSKNLIALCFHIYREVVTAHIEKSSQRIEEILPIAQKLRSAWTELKEREGGGGNER